MSQNIEGENPVVETEGTVQEQTEQVQGESTGNLFSTADVDELEQEEGDADMDVEAVAEGEDDLKDVDVDVELEDGDDESKKRKLDETETSENSEKSKEVPKKKAKKDPMLKHAKAPLPKLPELTRKDKTLEEILEMMDDEEFTPIIPDNVTDYYLSKNGFQTTNLKIKRLLALATQKFISDIATDAYEYSRIRSQTAVYNASNPQARARALILAGQQSASVEETGGASNGSGASGTGVGASGTAQSTASTSTAGGASGNQQNTKITLTMEDLSSALDEYGLNVNRPQFYR